MAQSTKSNPDPLDGYRRTPSEYNEMEDELRAFQAVATDPINVSLLRDVLIKDELKEELTNESSSLKRLATYVCDVYEAAQQDWVGEDTPDTEKAIAAHSRARAARMVMDWIAVQIETGEQAQRELEVEANDERR